uniref:Tubulin polyglutamylase TTLL4 n=1 Tax=Syphacia muris TaxID=451379 RepID=A0A0N5AG15_9BILA
MLHRHASVRIPTKRAEHSSIIHGTGISKCQGLSMATGFTNFPRGIYIIFVVGICLTMLNVLQLYNNQRKSEHVAKEISRNGQKPVAWVRGDKAQTGYLSSIITVLERIGYEVITGKKLGYSNETKFNLFWNHEYPFKNKKLEPYVANLKAFQKVNHIPGSGYYTSKVNLATADISEGVPKGFQMPDGRDAFLRFASEHPETLWVQKSNEHRGVKVQKLNQLRLDDNDHFIQQFISNPLLIDGRKFDIAVYAAITSVSPLRVYVYDGDVILRFCNQNYNPFEAAVPEKYVVGDDYTPVWEVKEFVNITFVWNLAATSLQKLLQPFSKRVKDKSLKMPSLKPYYVDQHLTFKETFNAFISSLDFDPEIIWDVIKETIAEVTIELLPVFQSQQRHLIEAAKKFNEKRFHTRPFAINKNFVGDPRFSYYNFRPFFELSRFDFLVDSNFKVFLMEVNMSPNLSTAHFPQNRLFFEKILYDLFSLVGVASYLHGNDFETNFKDKSIREMEVSTRDIVINTQDCVSLCSEKEQCRKRVKCQLCNSCLTYNNKIILKAAYAEHMSQRMFRRILPATKHKPKHVNRVYSEVDRMLILWFDQKCQRDKSWCN